MKVKVKRVRGGSMGDQRNYGLVTGSIWNYENKPTTNSVSETMTPASREDATIEAERGETVVGDLNNDGQLEHLKIGGKRHSEGGTPLNVPDGSFVFSDYKGLLIKNKDLLSNVFNYKGGKSATPAKVAGRYELNRYNDILNDPNADFLDQKTAQLMIDNNLKKLGQLALVQESMKGFPDGIPNISLPLFGSDMRAGGNMQTMKKGGLVKAQKGKSVKNDYSEEMEDYWASRGLTGTVNPDYRDFIYERNPTTEKLDYLLNLLQNPVSAASYFIDPRAQNETPTAYMKNSPHSLDLPMQSAFWKIPLGAYLTDSMLRTITEQDGGQYMQTAGEKKPVEEPGFFDKYAGPAAIGGIGLPLAYYLAGKLKDVVKPYWRQTVPAKYEIRPLTNKQGKPYQRGLTNRAGDPYVRGPKAGRSVKELVSPARETGIAPTMAKVKKPIAETWARIPTPLKVLAGLGILAGTQYPRFKGLFDKYNKPDPEAVDVNAAQDNYFNAPPDSTPTNVTQSFLDSVYNNSPYSPVDTVIPMRNDSVVSPQPTPQVKNQSVLPARRREEDSATYWGKHYTMPSDTSESFRIGGSNLPWAQSTGQTGIKYVIQPPQFRPLLNDFDVDRPAYYPGWEDVGEQKTASGDFTIGRSREVLPKRGIRNPKTGVAYTGIDDFINYANPYVNFEDYDTETNDPAKGIAQWKRDVGSADQATRDKAGRWLYSRANEYNQITSGNPNLITVDPSLPGASILGSQMLNIPFLKRKAQQPAAPPVAATTQTTQKTGEEAQTTGPTFEGMVRPPSVGFSPQDLAGMIGIAGQRIPDYLLAASRMDASRAGQGFTEFDPSATLGAYNAYGQNMGTGPGSRGAMMSASGAAGKTLEAINRERQANRASNIDVFLRTSAANQQAENAANLYNAEEQKALVDRANVLENANVEALNKKLADFTKQYSTGLTNIGRLNAINAMLPYQYSDWLTTSVDPKLRSIYDDPITGTTASGNDYDSLYNSVYKRLIDAGVSKSEAAIEASNTAARLASTRSRSTGTRGSAASIYDFMTT